MTNISMKRSRQRDAILECVVQHHDHPTADIIYQEVRNSFPNISLGTVYRNLSLLTDLGKIRKITCGDNADHFDGTVTPHAHFFCDCCGSLTDLPDDMNPKLEINPSSSFKGQIKEQFILLRGVCEHCIDQQKQYS